MSGDPNEARIAELGKGLMFVKRELAALPGRLAPGERLFNLACGTYNRHQGVVALTDRRVIFLDERITGHTEEDFPIDRITSVRSGHSVLSGSLTIMAAGAAADLTNVTPKERATAIAEYIRERLATPQSVPSPGNVIATPATDPAERLRKLAELRDAGVISPEDFETQKARILSEI